MHNSLRITVSSLVGLFVFANTIARAETPPNIVLIMADDMGFSDIGCYGGEIDTPNLNRMAKEGVRFRQFYNNAKCTTTRASLVTGLYPRPKGGLLKQDMVTIGEVLGEAGYQTSLSGKWHLGNGKTTHPFQRGFDRYYGLLDGCCNFFNPLQPDPAFKGGKVRKFGHDDRDVTEFPGDYYATDAFTDHAVESIEQFAKAEKPFFVHVCYTAPHYPLHAKPKDIAKYRGKYMIGWEELRRQRHERQLAMGLLDPRWPLSDTDSASYDWETSDKEWEDLRMAVYAAMIDCMDQNIGRILQALDDQGVAKNTLVMFLSDNGGCSEEPGGRNTKAIPGQREFYTAVGPAWGWAQNTPFRRYKSWVHEGGISTPFIARWPGVVKPDTMTDQVAHLVDLMATCVDVTGSEYPRNYDGRDIFPLEGSSLAPVLRGETRVGHDSLYWEWSGNRAVRQGKWKLVWDKLVKEWELYDVAADRTETNDLAETHPDRAKAMADDWFAWADRTGNKY
ncbi:MAG: arylsulfatase [Planctomycetota bacterium]|nr:arylsulfatase [Planctomycetota bacterium]